MPKVLYVENNEICHDLIPRRLTRKRFNCILATTRHQAIYSARIELPDLILIGMSLSKQSAWAATKAIKKAEQTKHIPIIALVTDESFENREQALKAGCDDYETRPIQFPRLLEKINRLLSR